MNTQQASVQQHKLLGLEVMRFVAALAVLVWHYQHFFYLADKPTDFVREQQPLYSVLSLLYDHGYWGVQVFWCISGFIFFWKYKDAIGGKTVSPRKFFVLRFSRLYPLHFATLLLVALLQAIYVSQRDFYFVYQNNDIPTFILQLFLASNWGFEKGTSFNGPIWSISIEVLIYFFFFLVLRSVGSSFLVNIGVLLLCFAAKLLKISTPIFDCLAFFYVGGLSALALQYFQHTNYKTLLNALAFSALLIAPVAVYGTNTYKHKYFPILFLLTYTPTLLFISAQFITAPPNIQKMIVTAGNMTYSSYLVHFPIQLGIALYFTIINQTIPYHSVSFFAGFMATTLMASYWIYYFFELPAQTYIRKNLK